MAKVRFFESNSVSTICLQDYTLPQADSTRLNFDFDYPSIENPCYFINHSKTNPFWMQFRTDVETFTAVIVNESGTETNINANIADGAELDNGTKQYELYLKQSEKIQ